MKLNRKLVIGDIHGGLKGLKQVIERANVTQDDTLIFLGDYVDGWSDSFNLIEYLIELNQTNNCIFIRGNHDQLFLDYLINNHSEINISSWFKHGGTATLLAYKNKSESQLAKHIDFLKDLRDYYIDDKNRLFIHAGFTNLNGIEHEYFSKYFYWDRTLWEMAVALNPNLDKDNVLYPSRLKLYHEIYIGHTPTTKINISVPANKANVWNIDTGAGFKGRLSILDIDTKEFWQSDQLNVLYFLEKGRN